MPTDKSPPGDPGHAHLKIIALGPVDGYGIFRRIRQILKDVLQVQAMGVASIRDPKRSGALSEKVTEALVAARFLQVGKWLPRSGEILLQLKSISVGLMQG